MKTNVLSFLVAKILALKQKISGITNDFMCLVKDKLEYDEKVNTFLIRNSEWDTYNNMQKILWMVVLFVVIPGLILFDYASLKPFVEYLQHLVGKDGIGKLFKFIGFAIFFILELSVCMGIIRINEYMERDPNVKWKFAKFLLAVAMITVPSILIFAGYLLQKSPTPADGMKTFALILVSLVVHCILFLLIDSMLKAIAYIVFLIHKQLLKWQNPAKRIESCKKTLLQLYPLYDIDEVRLSELPEATIYLPTIKLGKREKMLREKLEDGLDEEDFQELINQKSHSFKPKTSSYPTTSVVW